MAADPHVYRVTYADGHIAAVVTRRSLAGKIGTHNDTQRTFLRDREYRAEFPNVYRDRPAPEQPTRRYTIVKIERSPLGGWEDVTSEMKALEAIAHA